jgi:hypothetical protein
MGQCGGAWLPSYWRRKNSTGARENRFLHVEQYQDEWWPCVRSNFNAGSLRISYINSSPTPQDLLLLTTPTAHSPHLSISASQRKFFHSNKTRNYVHPYLSRYDCPFGLRLYSSGQSSSRCLCNCNRLYHCSRTKSNRSLHQLHCVWWYRLPARHSWIIHLGGSYNVC